MAKVEYIATYLRLAVFGGLVGWRWGKWGRLIPEQTTLEQDIPVQTVSLP